MKGIDLKKFLVGKVPFEYRVGSLPGDDKVAAAAIMEGPGRPDAEVIRLEERAFQIVVRDKDLPTVEESARAIYRALHGVNSVMIGDMRVDGIRAVQTPFLIGYDDKDRPLFSFNIRVTGIIGGTTTT